MVSIACITLLLGSGSAVLDNATQAAAIESIAFVDPSQPARLKPYQPLLVRIRVVGASNAGDLASLASETLARRFSINDESFPEADSTPGMNMHGWLELEAVETSDTEGQSKSIEFLGLIFCGFGDPRFVFDEPGEYVVGFGNAKLKVFVDDVAGSEIELVSRLRELGSDFASFVLKPHDPRLKSTALEVEQLLSQFPETAYSEMLDVSVGISKFRRILRERGSGADLRQSSEQLSDVRRFFEPHTQGELLTYFQVLAGHHLAQINKERYSGIGTAAAPDPTVRKEDFVSLYRKIDRSPYAGQYRRSAREALRTLHD